jgi:hypothetical protein
MATMPTLTQAAQDVLAERQRQIEREGWTPEHDDDDHNLGELADAAACYARQASLQVQGIGKFAKSPLPHWPWDNLDWKPKDARRNLVRAGALILAEIERMDRAASADGSGVKGGSDATSA